MADGTGQGGIGRIIETDACVAEGADWLARAEPRFGPGAGAAARCRCAAARRVRAAALGDRRPAGLASPRPARSGRGWRRRGSSPRRPSLARDEEDLRALGLSRQKARYARALAEAGIDYAALRAAPTDEVVATLTAVPGIGVWTAEIYAMFSARPGRRLRARRPRPAGRRALALRPARAPARSARCAQMAEAWSPVAVGCGAAALGLLPRRQAEGGHPDDAGSESRAQGAAIGRNALGRGLPARLRRQRRRPAGAGRSAGRASARHAVRRARRARGLRRRADGLPVVPDPLDRRVVRGGGEAGHGPRGRRT